MAFWLLKVSLNVFCRCYSNMYGIAKICFKTIQEIELGLDEAESICGKILRITAFCVIDV